MASTGNNNRFSEPGGFYNLVVHLEVQDRYADQIDWFIGPRNEGDVTVSYSLGYINLHDTPKGKQERLRPRLSRAAGDKSADGAVLLDDAFALYDLAKHDDKSAKISFRKVVPEARQENGRSQGRSTRQKFERFAD